ncbi:hypothetical protein QFC22_000959 [Naganishia vaughanmartiniae]|uniref:Uncharacterized protein n=1 Tax=Naganishia vaughanmartiniae TaxID=1424756 RepID=A0ACC2XJM7_9TREE|nr:hypothetical protein QFC22_000959 [Naganishia vaughanmartiniae]
MKRRPTNGGRKKRSRQDQHNKDSKPSTHTGSSPSSAITKERVNRAKEPEGIRQQLKIMEMTLRQSVVNHCKARSQGSRTERNNKDLADQVEEMEWQSPTHISTKINDNLRATINDQKRTIAHLQLFIASIEEEYDRLAV